MTQVHKYHLAPYQGPASRHTCPRCGGKRQLVRYLVAATGRELAEHVGRCNRERKCGYHYTPRHYFQDQAPFAPPPPSTPTA